MPKVWVRAELRLHGVLGFFLALALSLGGTASASRIPLSCGKSLEQIAQATKTLEEVRELRVGTYNVLNLYFTPAEYQQLGEKDGVPILKRVKPEMIKPEHHIKGVAKAILDSNLDVVVLQEVEGRRTLEAFNRDYLGGQYEIHFTPGNDQFAVEIAFLVKKSLPFEVELRTHVNERWRDPTKDGRSVKLFTRDVPTLIMRAPGLIKPLFVLMGAHYKAMSDRPDDPKSMRLRRVQVERTVKIIGDYRREFGADVPFMLAGDFNGDIHRDSPFRGLHRTAKLVDTLDARKEGPRLSSRATHVQIWEDDSPTETLQLDGILVSSELANLVKSSWIYRYTDEKGAVRPFPRSFEERNENPSDHYPVIAVFDFYSLFRSRR